MSTHDLFLTLLRPAVLHILRASGFQGAKPSVVDTLVDLTARYMTLLASRTAYNAYSNHNELEPDVSDVRMAMQDCGLLIPAMTAGEELWSEILRKPLEEYDEDSGARAKEEKRRDADDTADVTAFIDWVKGDQNKEIRRIAGVLKQPQPTAAEQLDAVELEDYMSSLMKKHSKTGVDSRYQGTILGKPAELRAVKIEGGAVDSIEEWCRKTRERAIKTTEQARENQDLVNHTEEVIESKEEIEDVVMETQ
ncbi:bromodomain associated domain-containing protein [Massarina eburnea CBS 473.64]|uniref:Bromodomain associated domain-containing protein n=1 Tax=Massarina eburnea CBS 473.64 TaxID=1395130 RepID=A0A6A6RKJ1_9PLEO|nr:bromodomain associated domain-containing protein [Massarina eburnea CBS 473.64]